MKIIFAIAFLSLIGCDEYPKHVLGVRSNVPDSLKDKQANFVIETTKAASFHMTGGDYEDPEDVIEKANEIFERIYSVEVDGMFTYPGHGAHPTFTQESDLTPSQLIIYKELKGF